MPRTIAGVLALSSLLFACKSLSLRPPLPLLTSSPQIFPVSTVPELTVAAGWDQIPLHVGHGVRGKWFEIYFTDPADPASVQSTGGLDEPLAAAIDDAHLSVHVAMYNLSLNTVRDALIRAYRRGVDVRVVLESDNLDREAPQAMKEAGIPLLGDRREGLMHNKFMVIDRNEVWTGSMNFTTSGVYLDNNNVIRIHSNEVSAFYENEFEEMFTRDRFGPNSGGATPGSRVMVGDTPVEIYFAPDDDVQSALLALLDSAQSSIEFLAYSFTSDTLGDALLRAAANGVEVSGVMDADQGSSNQGTELGNFRSSGLDVRLDGNPGQMHHKLFIVDDNFVALGSYNYTRSAQTTNDENLVVVDSPDIAQIYLQEFRLIFGKADR